MNILTEGAFGLTLKPVAGETNSMTVVVRYLIVQVRELRGGGDTQLGKSSFVFESLAAPDGDNVRRCGGENNRDTRKFVSHRHWPLTRYDLIYAPGSDVRAP